MSGLVNAKRNIYKFSGKCSDSKLNVGKREQEMSFAIL